jgi:hypothetical protein
LIACSSCRNSSRLAVEHPRLCTRTLQTTVLQTTLAEALSIFALHHANTGGAAVYLHRWGETFVLGYGIYDRDATAREQVHALIMALGWNIISGITNVAAAALLVR